MASLNAVARDLGEQWGKDHVVVPVDQGDGGILIMAKVPLQLAHSVRTGKPTTKDDNVWHTSLLAIPPGALVVSESFPLHERCRISLTTAVLHHILPCSNKLAEHVGQDATVAVVLSLDR